MSNRNGPNRSRWLTSAFVAGAAALALASPALACTTFKGRMALVGDANSGNSNAYGSGSGMRYCSITGGATSFVTNDTGNDVGVLIQPNTISGCQNQLGVNFRTYQVNFVNYTDAGAPGFTRNGDVYTINVPAGDCMSPVIPGVVGIGSMTVDSGGFSLRTDGTRGSRSYNFNAGTSKTWTANKVTDSSGVCISDPNGNEGNQAPINLINV